MKLLLIGSGGREHALLTALKRSPKLTDIYVTPGNGGTAEHNITLDLANHATVIEFCKAKVISLVVIGPEAPLVDGLVDSLEAAQILVFGPRKNAAILEASKDFTKHFCDQYHIPTASYQSFDKPESAKAYVRKQSLPIVIKADGLAAGKGVIIAETLAEAEAAIEEILSGKFGEAGNRIVIEEFLVGEEVSAFALVDGERAVWFGSAQDHKRVGDGDTGPNTGGMGTYTPAPVMTSALERDVMERIILPTVKGMKQEGRAFKGVLFAGLMITAKGPYLIEYNVRFGDPETQSLMTRLKSDLLELMLATAKGDLSGQKVEMHQDAALCVVMAAKGYPDTYQKGTTIKNLDKAGALDGVTIFHAGTAQNAQGEFIANGGRVLGVTARGATVLEAQRRAYQAVDLIDWKEGFCRRDIGWRAVERLKKQA